MRLKLCFFIFSALFALSGFSQGYPLTVEGHVYDMSGNFIAPLSGHEVSISIDSTNTGFEYESDVYTDSLGYFQDIILLPTEVTQGLVTLSTQDPCTGEEQYQVGAFSGGLTLPSFDFYLCNTIPSGCQANYDYQPSPADPLTIMFSNNSLGNYTVSHWDFGDSTYSDNENPVHTYQTSGDYYVCLTVLDSSEYCNDTQCKNVIVGDSTYYGCENSFSYTYEDQYTVEFEGYLLNNMEALSYSWDFGDGTSGEGQNISHTFQPNGMAYFTVCLTTTYSDSTTGSCTYTSCQDVWIYNQPGCQASFYYMPDSLDELTLHFYDNSFTPNGNQADSWTWDFGDGTTSILQNPVHMYADSGYYYVCLTINTIADSCTSTYCDTVYTGFPPPSGCDNSFEYEQMNDSLTYQFHGEAYWGGMINPDGTLFFWDFGDGTTGTGEEIVHSFQPNNTGYYTVCLQTVISNPNMDSCIAYSCKDVWVNVNPGGDCNSWFEYTEDSLTVNYTGYTNSNFYTEYTWEFGDGTSGTGQVISHTYNENGTYNVTLMTSDSTACSWTSEQSIFVGNPTFSVFGRVYLSNQELADAAEVHLFASDTLWQNPEEIGAIAIDSNGFYQFDNIPMDPATWLFAQAELTEGSAHYGDYIPTYYINALSWEDAMPILPLNNWPADIYMIPSTTLNSGGGSIYGTVTDLNARAPLNNVEVLILNSDMQPYSYLRSNENGEFDFSNLAYGTYKVMVEIPGIQSTPATITLSEVQTSVNVEIQVDAGEANAFFGINEHLVSLTSLGNIYPNPVTGNAALELNLDKPTQLKFSIINQIGQNTLEINRTLNAGPQTIKLDLGKLKAGVYLILISSDQGDMAMRRLIKAR